MYFLHYKNNFEIEYELFFQKNHCRIEAYYLDFKIVIFNVLFILK